MIYLHKILPLFVLPLALALGLAAYGAARRRLKWVWIAIVALYAAATPLAGGALFGLVEAGMARRDARTVARADAVVVLSGMLHGVAGPGGAVMEWTDPDRFFGGVELFRAGVAPRLVFTGGTVPWLAHLPTEGAVLKAQAEAMGVPPEAIRVTAEAQNTAEEAAAVRALLGPQAPRIVLVTSAFHMPRAARQFAGAGFVVDAFPVDFKVGTASLTPMDFLPAAGALALSEAAVRELLGRAFYRIKAVIRP
ncbi:MAG: YdcF family protein [Burkholderiales bacterium]|nr:YdcF family protein [Burkholderiales bacterium]